MKRSYAALAAIAGLGIARVTLPLFFRRSVEGCAVVITGGSRGLGLELARTFGERGARIAIVARNREELGGAIDDLNGRGIEAYAFACDLTDQRAARECIADASARLGGIDILVNNAGRIDVGPFETMTDEDFEETMRLHFYAPLWTIRAALPSLRERRGRIVNISSIGGLLSVPHLLPYSASKFALVGLSEGLHSELGRFGIAVTTVCPGLMRTGSTENARFKSQHQKEYAWFALSDATPVTSVASRSAAKTILRATELGTPFVVVSAQAKLAAIVHAFFPNLTAKALALVARLLPGAGGIGSEHALGAQSRGAIRVPFLLGALDRAAKDLNQV